MTASSHTMVGEPGTGTGAVPQPESGAFLATWIVVGIASGLGLTYGLAVMHDGTIVDGTTTLTPATAVGVAALCYLAAAATTTRWVAWLGVPVFSGLAFAGLLVPLPWWALFGLVAAVLLVVGRLVGAGRVTAVQGAALFGFFGIAVLALHLAPRAGLALAGAVLAAHALWDIRHYRHDIVVDRSMAIFCIGLDVTVGALCVVLAIVS
ncbi:hypothetical protein GCM10023169_09970 [Georgenia halophila]|uniref:Uncharacterized protein n=1 Tax=Georgenia halophila TaxID=620889 RepID=A0ABP8KZX3_9MICO